MKIIFKITAAIGSANHPLIYWVYLDKALVL